MQWLVVNLFLLFLILVGAGAFGCSALASVAVA